MDVPVLDGRDDLITLGTRVEAEPFCLGLYDGVLHRYMRGAGDAQVCTARAEQP